MAKNKKSSIKKSNTQQKNIKQNHFQKEWLYLNQENITLFQIKELLEKEYSVEYWEEAGVLEVETNEKSSVDFETADINRADEMTKNFLEEKGAKTVLLVSLSTSVYEEAEQVFRKIIKHMAGFFCGDTPDFSPRVE